MYKIGLSTCGKSICEELFVNYKRSGIDAMEISVDDWQYDQLDYKAIHSFANKYGINLWSYHLPYYPFEKIEISLPETAKATIGYFSELIKKASDIGIDKFIVHPSGEPIADKERPERMKRAKESLAELAEIAKSNGAVIAVEDLPRTCLGNNSIEISELISAHKDLRVCFDTNHLLTENPVDFVRKLGDKIITVHISDYDFINERHWLPGEGKQDWNSLLKAFKEINYQGVWLYEINFACPNTIMRDRPLTCDDFVRNANELFAGRKPTVISKAAKKDI